MPSLPCMPPLSIGITCGWPTQGRRGKPARPARGFELQVADRLIELQGELNARRIVPARTATSPSTSRSGARSARRRSATGVHHALCNVIEPCFRGAFIADSYANRVGKGTHRGLDRLQDLVAGATAYVLRARTSCRHFPSLDHADPAARHRADDSGRRRAVAGRHHPGERRGRAGQDEYEMVYFPGDDLLALPAPAWLPIGNLTSQFWSDVDTPIRATGSPRVEPQLRGIPALRGRLRSVAGQQGGELWEWKRAIDRPAGHVRLTTSTRRPAQVQPTRAGIPVARVSWSIRRTDC